MVSVSEAPPETMPLIDNVPPVPTRNVSDAPSVRVEVEMVSVPLVRPLASIPTDVVPSEAVMTLPSVKAYKPEIFQPPIDPN